MTDVIKKFWTEWLEMEETDRPKKILQLVTGCLNDYMSEEAKKNELLTASLCKILNSYFEDLHETIRGNENEKRG